MISAGENCSVGGMRFTDPNGRTETFCFPEDQWDREELLSSVDPAVRDGLEAALDEGGFYDLAMSGMSAPEGEGLEITLKSPQERFPRHILVMGAIDHSGGSAKEPMSDWCTAMLVIGGATATGVVTGMVISAKRKSGKGTYFTVLGGAVGSVFAGIAAMKCLSPPSPPTPPSPPRGPGGSGPGRRGVSITHRTQLEPLPLWLLPAALVVGAIFYMSGGGLVAQPAGFSLTKEETKWEM